MPTERHRRSRGESGSGRGSDGEGSSSRRSSSSKSDSKSKSKSKSKGRTGKKISRGLGKITEGIEKGFKVFAEAANGIIDMILSVLFPKALRKKVDKLGKSKQAKRVSKKVSKQVGKLTDNVEKSFKKGASGFTEVFGFLFAILVPKFIRTRVEKAWKAVGDRVSKFFKRVNKGMANWAEKYLPAWLVNFFKATSKRLKRARKNASKFANVWFKSRDFVTLAWSTPAILMALPVAAMLTLSVAQSGGARMLHYVNAARTYDDQGKFELSSLCRKKLVALGYQQMERQEYRAALELERDGRLDEAYRLMRELAPLSSQFMARLKRAAEADVEFLGRLNRDPSEEATYQDSSKTISTPTVSTGSSGLNVARSVTDSFNEAAYATALPTTDSDRANSDKANSEGPIEANVSSAGTAADESDDALTEDSSDGEGSGQLAFADKSDLDLYKDNYKEAHLWIGKALLDNKIDVGNERERWALIREHARVANTIYRRDMERYLTKKDLYEDELGQNTIYEVMSAVFLIEYMKNQGDPVVGRMIKVAEAYRPYSAPLLRYYHSEGNFAKAAVYARRYITHLTKTIQYNEKEVLSSQVQIPSEQQLVSLIEAHLVLGHRERAESLAREGGEFHKSDLLSSLRALTLRRDMMRLNPFDVNYTQKLLDIHELAPEDVTIARKLAQQIRNEGTLNVDELLAEGKIGASLLLELGNVAFDDGRLSDAEARGRAAMKRFEQVLELDDKTREQESLAYNNIAHTLVDRLLETYYGADGQQDVLEKALESVTKAMEIEQKATYYETLGQIRYKMRDFEAAVEAFEHALNGNLSQTDQRNCHLALSEIYKNNGNTELQRIHQLEAQKIDSSRGAASRLGN